MANRERVPVHQSSHRKTRQERQRTRDWDPPAAGAQRSHDPGDTQESGRRRRARRQAAASLQQEDPCWDVAGRSPKRIDRFNSADWWDSGIGVTAGPRVL